MHYIALYGGAILIGGLIAALPLLWSNLSPLNNDRKQ